MYNVVTLSLWCCTFAHYRRLSGNQLRHIPGLAFDGLYNLRVLMLQNNQLERLPSAAVWDLPNLLSLRLDANLIPMVPDRAFLGLRSLRHLWLDDNALTEVPVHSLAHLPSLQALTLAMNGITHIPSAAFHNLSSLVVLHLQNNKIQSLELSCFKGLRSLEILDMNHNALHEIPVAVKTLAKLRELGLHNNKIRAIPEEAFAGNMFLHTINIYGNPIDYVGPSTFQYLPKLHTLCLGEKTRLCHTSQGDDNHFICSCLGRVIEMPYAYQCCNFGSCNNNYFLGSQNDHEELHERTVVTSKSIISENLDLEEFLLEAEDKLQVDIYCTPIPGPFRPCRYLFDSWIVRVGIWAITLTSLVCNSLLVWTAVSPSGCHSPVKVLVGSIAGANFLTGLCTGTLALVDAWTFGEFSQHGTWWESGPLCQLIGFISVFSSEASILFLGLAILFCSFTASHLRVYDKFHFTHIRAGIVVCVVLSLAIATLPVLKVGRYSMSPLCLPTMLQEGQSSTLSFTAGLIIANALCFMLITVTIIKLLWHMSKCYSVHLTNFAMIKHLAWLVFSNVLIYSPIICLTFSSLIGRLHISSEIVKSIQLVLMHLPASLNPLLYILFSPYLVDDLHQLWKTSLSTQPRTLHLFYMRQSMQTLVRCSFTTNYSLSYVLYLIYKCTLGGQQCLLVITCGTKTVVKYISI
uniref:Leucine rich repeat containing G protein-coupled receptor 6 n=1 Tax=Scleropages formosus TaxID=113540 RepID=A0A8C9QVN1_SCLFO